MKISYSWLKDYVNTDLSVAEIANSLTFCGLEVESVEDFEKIKGGLQGLVTGEVISKEKHPDADKLSLTTVNTGGESLLQIVCGAPNVAVGQKVIVALVGAKLYPTQGESFEIKKSKIRGVVSEGMICAEDEIGLGNAHEGIMVLPDDTPVGIPAAQYFKLEKDTVFEIGLTPNRVDAASHIGVARDLAAVLAVRLQKDISIKYPKVEELNSQNNQFHIDVELADTQACIRYSAVCINNISVGESPEWLKNYLAAIGLKSINNIVDITNFVLFETGQPLHAFDGDVIKGNKVIVRKAMDGTRFTLLDGSERVLTANDLMICNTQEPMCMAGIYGGLHSGVKPETNKIFLESACFEPSGIRKSSKQHNLKTDSSFRFERGTDPEATLFALKRAALLIQQIAGGTISSAVTDIYPIKAIPVVLPFSLKKCAQLIGKQIPESTIKTILKHLEIQVLKQEDDMLTLQIPLCKVDVKREVDVIEEILRIYGYNNVEEPEQMRISLINKVTSDTEAVLRKTRMVLCGSGMQEIWNNSLTASDYTLHHLKVKSHTIVKLQNSLSSELDSLRQSLLFGMLETMRYNINRKSQQLKLFEIGKVYFKTDTAYIEKNMLALAFYGNQHAESWQGKPEKENIFRLKGVLQNLFTQLGVNPKAQSEVTNELYSECLQFQLENKTVAYLGTLNNNLLKIFDIPSEVFYAEIMLDDIFNKVSQQKVYYHEVSKFPEVRRDLALLVNENVTYEQMVQLAHKTEKNLLQAVTLFDVYQGKNLEQGKKSYALTFTLLDNKATLTEKQIEKTMNKLIQAFQSELGATLRQ